MELQKRRRTVTEPECRYFVRQVALACAYLHKSHVIHRDLKLGNLFLDDAMQIKIGDFGLATRLDFDGERKLYAPLQYNMQFLAPDLQAWGPFDRPTNVGQCNTRKCCQMIQEFSSS